MAFSRSEAWRLVVASAVLISLLGALLMLVNLVGMQRMFDDFTVFWASAQVPPASAYDPERLTAVQRPYLLNDVGLRPFSYPPTLLVGTQAMAGLPYRAALLGWSILGLAAFLASAWAAWGPRVAGLSLLGFPVLLTLAGGQVALFASALLVIGLARLEVAPRLAGAALALAAALKPQLALLVPFALVAGGHWRVLAAAALAGGIAVALSILALGAPIWREWLASLPRFLAIVSEPRFWSMSVSPYVLALRLGMPAEVARLIPAVLGPCGVAAVALVFRRRAPLEHRLLAVVAGGMLCVPYAMLYDLAAVAPAAAALLLRPDAQRRDWLAGLLAFTSLGGAVVPIGVILVALSRYRDFGRDPLPRPASG